jgi:hypothetical protein
MTQQPDADRDNQPDVEQRYQEMDSKLIQMQILAELQAIRQALTEAQPLADESVSQEPAKSPDKYRCKKCGAVVPAGEQGDHAMERHKAPPSRVAHMFEPA